ncbi:MAG TPA: site-specific integrase [Steroidobacter sp.]|uniref:site-specific integrase n=1 Tax=Steroidobacter sp. TaxID=1978227 RepID=UPI002EDB9976
MSLDRTLALGRSAAGWLLPALVRTRSGAQFDPSLDVWSYRDTVNKVVLDFSFFNALSEEMRHSLKYTLVWYAENASAPHVRNMFSRFLHLVGFLSVGRATAIEQVTNVDLLNYKGSLSPETAYYLGSLSGFLRKWHGLGVPGVTDDAVAVLEALRLKGNAKGVAVLTMDPRMGPFTDLEFEQIQSALNEAFAEGALSEEAYLLAWLFMALGQRSSQFAALKVCDVTGVGVDGAVDYAIRVPRLKQRNAGPRLELKERPLIPQIGKPLLEYANRVRQRFESVLANPDDAPLFPVSVERAPRVHDWAPGYEYHQTGWNLGRNLKRTLELLEVYSERTGDLLHVSPIRFRRTFGTRAAQEGHGELVIAEMLDHTDTQNVGVYVAAVPEIAARIDRAIAMQLAPLAQAFKGVLIKTESEATRGNDPSSRIVDPRIDRSMQPMGSCGQHSFCSFNAPIACYTCQHFQPWVDGPHEAVLSHLLEKREQLLATTDQRMASVNDSTILAVAQVIHLCRQAQGAPPEVKNG